MKDLHVLGVTHVNDSYPNVKYKLAALKQLLGEDYVEFVIPLDKTGASQRILSSLDSNWLVFIWRTLIGHIKVFLYSILHRAKKIYVCYPGIFIAVWLGLPFMRTRYQAVYLDGFISLYDTIVCDRRLLKAGSCLAKLLYRLEQRAFKSVTVIIVDTPENAKYYSELFDISQNNFYVVPLSIPPLLPTTQMKIDEKRLGRIRCVFVGTFVPLQGISTIVEAIKLLVNGPKIDFVFVGDGQDAKYLHDYIDNSTALNVIWYRGHFSTEFIVSQINDADICLGVFGEGSKTQRVLPYKIYYYLALGMPVLTAATVTTKRILTECNNLGEHAPLVLVPPGDAQLLANAIRQLCDSHVELARMGSAGANYYRSTLADMAIQQALRNLIETV